MPTMIAEPRTSAPQLDEPEDAQAALSAFLGGTHLYRPSGAVPRELRAANSCQIRARVSAP